MRTNLVIAAALGLYAATLNQAAADATEDEAVLLGRFDDQALPQEFVRLFQPDVTVEGWDGMSTRQWLTRVAALLR